MNKFTTAIEQYVIPLLVTVLIITESGLPETWVSPLAIGVTVVCMIISIIHAMWIVALGRLKTIKADDMLKRMLGDAELIGRGREVSAITLLSLIGLFLGSYVVSILFMTALITAIIRYWGYLATKYDDDFQDPDGFV